MTFKHSCLQRDPLESLIHATFILAFNPVQQETPGFCMDHAGIKDKIKLGLKKEDQKGKKRHVMQTYQFIL